MRMTIKEFETLMRLGKQTDGFIRSLDSHMALGKTRPEAKELAYDSWYPVALALKHKLDINGSGKIKTKINLDELISKGDPTRDVMWVYDHLDYPDVCNLGETPSHPKQPIAPSRMAHALWRTYKYMDNGYEEFMKGLYLKYGPQKKDIELMQKNKDDGRHLIELNKDIAQAKRKSEALALQKSLN